MVQKITNIIQKVENKADSLVLPYMRENMRGLGTFISDIRNCKSREAEQKRVNKELVHIRQKFKTDRTIDPYSRRKYIAKLLFIHLLGHDVNFGHVEAGGLIGSPRYQDKQIGYLFLSVLYCEDGEISRMLMTSLVNDLQSGNINFVLLALQCLTFMISPTLVEEYGEVLINLIKAYPTNDAVMRTALLCYGGMFRASPDFLTKNSELNKNLMEMAKKTTNYGLTLQYVSVFFQASIISPSIFESVIPHLISCLKALVSNSSPGLSENTYYQVPSPWTQIKIMQFLMLYPPIDAISQQLHDICGDILKKRFEIGTSNKVHFLNIRAAISFEAINLIIHYNFNDALLEEAVKALASYLVGKDVNYRYLTLEVLTRMASNEQTVNLIKPFTDVILKVVTEEKDTSVRLLAVDLIYLICNTKTVPIIIPELLKFLNSAEFSIRHELALKIAFISEKYVDNNHWYLDTMMTLVQLAGNYISEDLWFRIVQILANVPAMQSYAATKAFMMLQSTNTNETLIKLVSYVLGEYGNMIANDPKSSPSIQLQLLISVFYFVDAETKAIILTSMAKMYNLYPEIKEHILSFFQTDQIKCNIDIEIQQRVFEFLGLARCPPQFIATVLEVMPPYTLPELSELLINKIESSTLRRRSIASTARSKTGSPVSHQSGERSLTAVKETSAAPAPAVSTNLLEDLFSDNVTTYENTYTQPTDNFYFDAMDPVSSTEFKPAPTVTVPLLCTGYYLNGDDLKKHFFQNSGKIYTDSMVSISMQAAYKAHLGRYEVSVLSNSASDFTVSKVEFSNHDGLAIELLNKAVSSYDSQGGLAIFNFQVALLDTFESLPVLNLLINGSTKIDVLLPIFMHKFVQPYNMDAQRFTSIWQSLTSSEFSSQVPVSPKIPSASAIVETIGKTNFQVLSGIDNDPSHIFASGIVNTANGTVGVVLMIEAKAGSTLLTVKASKAKIPSIVSSAMAALL